ncbi:DUF4153 domain-containing protein [Methyloceanibacter sp.]|uniref:DUF4153 domain-containing protein n=1 Tax=Methyloceanibacter sp. TaxID=1965321 RepID=UPI002D24E53E|nr:DUF4153 domain-containing protein [Methyloceanibacter sp.]HZP08912.1 DUF4153 domain-containing protein [Methyloceanibacter sp.]
MVEALRTSWWRRRRPDLAAAASRFPLPVLIAGLLTFYRLNHDFARDVDMRIMGALVASFLWAVAVDLFSESGRRPFAARVALWIAGIAAIAALFHFFWELWVSPHLLLGALLILVGLAAYLGRQGSNAAFWLFNHRLWLGAALAAVGAGLFAAGLVAIIETVKLLFGLTPPAHMQEHIATLGLCFVAPVSFLAFAPSSFTDPITAREEGDFTMRAAAALTKFVLVPLLLVYTAILYAYAVKIALAWELPKGTLGGMVVGYLLVGAATLLVGYPSRETGGAHVRFFFNYWVELTALPVLLLFVAVGRRIADYGVTEQRYLMVLIGVWALILAGLRVARGGDFDLRPVPGVLAALMLAASFGPGGAIGVSVMSQKQQLAELLTAKGMLVEGRIVPRGEGAPENPLGSEAWRARSIEWYLNTHRALHLLAPWFAGLPNDPFAAGKSPDETARDLLLALGLRADLGNSSGVVHFTHHSNTPIVLAPPKDAYVIGPIVFEASTPVLAIAPKTVVVDGLGTVTLALADRKLSARLEDGATASFDIDQAVKEVYARGWPNVMDHRPIALKAAASGLDGTMIIDNLNGTYQEPDFDISLLRFWLVLGRAG